MIWWWTCLVATAGQGGFYHPGDVAAVSQAFAQVNQPAVEEYTRLSGEARALAGALNRYEEAIDLLGAAGAGEDRARHQAWSAQFQRDFAVAQEFASAVLDDTETTFGVGLADALESQEPPPVVCAKPAEGPSITPSGLRMPARASRDPACDGDDLNAALAAAIDAHPGVRAATAEIAGREWPTLSIEAHPGVPVGPDAAAGWVDFGRLIRAATPEALAQIAEDDEDARLGFEEAIRQGASREEREAMIAESDAISLRTAEARAVLGAPAIEAITRWNERRAKRSESTVALCPTPLALGGCVGPDLTDPMLGVLLADKRVSRALGR